MNHESSHPDVAPPGPDDHNDQFASAHEQAAQLQSDDLIKELDWSSQQAQELQNWRGAETAKSEAWREGQVDQQRQWLEAQYEKIDLEAHKDKVEAVQARTELDTNTATEQIFTAEHAPELRDRLAADKLTTEDRTEFAHGEIIRYTPEITRLDKTTGKPVIPMLFVRGMGAAEADPWYLKELAEADERPVIGLHYNKLLKGSSRVDHELPDAAASKVDVLQAEDIPAALGRLEIKQVDAVGESRGAIRLALAMEKHPDLFRNAVLDHPAGQDRKGYIQTHVGAVKEKVARTFRLLKDGPQNRKPDGLDTKDRSNPITRVLNSRKEQKSVANAQLHNVLGRLDPRLHVIVTGDRHDRAFSTKRLRGTTDLAQKAGANVEFEETNWGGHGYRYNTESLRETVGRLRKLEHERN